MRDELLAGRRTGQQRPGALGVEPDEVIGPVRRSIGLGLHLGKLRIYHDRTAHRSDTVSPIMVSPLDTGGFQA